VGKLLKFLIVVVLIMGVASEIFLPVFMSSLIAQGMKSVTGSDNVVATLTKKPALLMLGGQFDSIAVTADHPQMDKIIFSEMSIALTNAHLDMGTLLRQHTVALQSVDGVAITAVMTQDELARYLSQTIKGVKNAVVVMSHDKIKVTSQFSIGILPNLSVSLEGRIVGDGQKIKFVTDQILINNTAAGNLGGALLTEFPLVDLNKLPFHVNVRDIVMESGKVSIYLDNQSNDSSR